eukprot:6807308-Prymnesium_polylepis.1
MRRSLAVSNALLALLEGSAPVGSNRCCGGTTSDSPVELAPSADDAPVPASRTWHSPASSTLSTMT